MKQLLNRLLMVTTGYQLAKHQNTLHGLGAQKRKFINKFILDCGPYGAVLDIGAAPCSLPKQICSDVTTFDQFAGPEVDVAGDLHHLSDSFPMDHFDTIVCTEVFEHTREPLVAMQEILKVLKPGGLFIGTAPLFNELHGEEYGDYWRITPQGWRYLLKDFENVTIKTFGTYPQVDHVGACATKRK